MCLKKRQTYKRISFHHFIRASLISINFRLSLNHLQTVCHFSIWNMNVLSHLSPTFSSSSFKLRFPHLFWNCFYTFSFQSEVVHFCRSFEWGFIFCNHYVSAPAIVIPIFVYSITELFIRMSTTVLCRYSG